MFVMVSGIDSKSMGPGSSPGWATMTKFIYNNIEYQTWNLKKELKKLGISKNDIQIVIEKPQIEQPDIDTSIIFYKWYNPITKHTLTSIIDSLPKDYNPNEWIKIN